jgi:alpha-beta hydrolase superfamily lysophospholipase
MTAVSKPYKVLHRFPFLWVLTAIVLGLGIPEQTLAQSSLFKILAKDEPVYEALLSAPDGSIDTVVSFDLTPIAIRTFLPLKNKPPKVLCVFIHGTSAQSKLYLPFADTLMKKGIGTVLIDLRGHGLSGGERGKTAGLSSLVRDIRLVLKALKHQYPDTKLVLGGHSLGAGLTLKYLEFFNGLDVDYVKPDGLLLMAGGFLRDPACNALETNRLDSIQQSGQFAKIYPFSLAGFIPMGLLGQQYYTLEVLFPENNPLVKQAIEQDIFTRKYSFQFFLSSFPLKPSLLYQRLKIPVVLVMGKQDELIATCDAIYSYKKLRTSKKQLLLFNSSNHINIIWESAGAIAWWLNDIYD